jgi:hypothetical protein
VQSDNPSFTGRSLPFPEAKCLRPSPSVGMSVQQTPKRQPHMGVLLHLSWQTVLVLESHYAAARESPVLRAPLPFMGTWLLVPSCHSRSRDRDRRFPVGPRGVLELCPDALPPEREP